GPGRRRRPAPAVRAAGPGPRPAAAATTGTGTDLRRLPARHGTTRGRLGEPVAALARLLAAQRPEPGAAGPARGVGTRTGRTRRDRLRRWPRTHRNRPGLSRRPRRRAARRGRRFRPAALRPPRGRDAMAAPLRRRLRARWAPAPAYPPTMTLYPQARAAIGAQEKVPLTVDRLDEVRQSIVDALDTEVGEGPPVRSSQDVDAGGVRARLYVPDGTAVPPVVVYLHGGGWVMGGLDTHDALCRMLADR